MNIYPEYVLYQNLKSNKEALVLDLMRATMLEEKVFLTAINNLVEHGIAVVKRKSPYTLAIGKNLTPSVMTAIYGKDLFEERLDELPEEVTSGNKFKDRLSLVEGYNNPNPGIKRPRQHKDEVIRKEKVRQGVLSAYLPDPIPVKYCDILPYGDITYETGKRAKKATKPQTEIFIESLRDAYKGQDLEFIEDNIRLVRTLGIRTNCEVLHMKSDYLMAYLFSKRGVNYVRGSFTSFDKYLAWAYRKPLAQCEVGEYIAMPRHPSANQDSITGVTQLKKIKSIDLEKGELQLAACSKESIEPGQMIFKYFVNEQGRLDVVFKDELNDAVIALNTFLSERRYEDCTAKNVLYRYHVYMASKGISFIEAALLESFVPKTYGFDWVCLWADVKREHPLAWQHNSLFYRISLLGMLYVDLPYKPYSLHSREHKAAWHYLPFSCFDFLLDVVRRPRPLSTFVLNYLT